MLNAPLTLKSQRDNFVAKGQPAPTLFSQNFPESIEELSLSPAGGPASNVMVGS